ncbi:hypothetical protein TIFTF001_043104 [Ficus carica]|uniref:Uncharacterized protein n=1 Tax=Ficus carica TaxID=3494 RepID=A0AA87Z7J8_FICCA|nr:hypothetical protein TIFTF001_043104 [Ficus carica]
MVRTTMRNHSCTLRTNKTLRGGPVGSHSSTTASPDHSCSARYSASGLPMRFLNHRSALWPALQHWLLSPQAYSGAAALQLAAAEPAICKVSSWKLIWALSLNFGRCSAQTLSCLLNLHFRANFFLSPQNSPKVD